jgi:hypothetical protein
LKEDRKAHRKIYGKSDVELAEGYIIGLRRTTLYNSFHDPAGCMYKIRAG